MSCFFSMIRIIYLFACLFVWPVALKSQQLNDEVRAYQYFQQGNYEQAANLFEKVFKQSGNETSFELYISSLLKIKQYQLAESAVKKNQNAEPNKFIYPLLLAKVYQESGQSADATKLQNAVIERFAKDEFSVRELANTFYRFENYDLAIACFLQGRKALKSPQAFALELLSLYRLRKDKIALVDEYLNALPSYPQWINQAKSVLGNLFDSNTDYQNLQYLLLRKLQKEPQNEVFNDLLIWQYLQQKEYDMVLRQLLAKDRRSKNTSAEIYDMAGIFVQNKAFDVAIKAYTCLEEKGSNTEWYVPAKIQLVNCKYELTKQGLVNQQSVVQLTNDFKAIIKQYGNNRQTLFAVRRLAWLQAYQLKQADSAELQLEQALKNPELAPLEIGELKLELAAIYLLNKQTWDALLLYEQVAKTLENTNIGSEARFRSAKISFYQGNFAYAKSQADVLKSSSSQLIANDAIKLSLLITLHSQNTSDSLALLGYAQADRLQAINQPQAAIQKLDSLTQQFPNSSLSDDILVAKAKIYTNLQQYQQAEQQLKQLINDYPSSIWQDEAIFLLANLYEQQLAKKTEALSLYQKLLSDFAGSMFANEARTRFRQLRGDK